MRVLRTRDVGALILEPALSLRVHVDVEGKALLLRTKHPNVTARVVVALELWTQRPPRFASRVGLATDGRVRLARRAALGRILQMEAWVAQAPHRRLLSHIIGVQTCVARAVGHACRGRL